MTPPHWRAEERKTLTLKDYEKKKKEMKRRDEEIERRADERRKRHEEQERKAKEKKLEEEILKKRDDDRRAKEQQQKVKLCDCKSASCRIKVPIFYLLLLLILRLSCTWLGTINEKLLAQYYIFYSYLRQN